MPFVTAEDGERIHYELEGPEDGIPLVLLHGAASRIESWIESGYVAALRDRFRLLLIDLRGNGLSDKPTRIEDYDFRTRVLDSLLAMQDAGIDNAHLWGYSLGSMTGMSAAIYAPQRFRSFVLGGVSPSRTPTAGPFERFWELYHERPGLKRESSEAVFHAYSRFAGATQALRTTRLPFLLYAGTEDVGPCQGVEEFAGKYGARYFTLPGRDHGAGFFDSAAEVVPQVTAFIDEVEAASK